jgi:hypothetical protein
MRCISFSLTTAQFLAGTKDVTRRIGWEKLKAGDDLKAVRKAMGLKRGETMEIIGHIRAVNVRREQLDRMLTDLDYGFAETTREGFPEGHDLHWPSRFVEFFCDTHAGCFPEREITRMEFVKL